MTEQEANELISVIIPIYNPGAPLKDCVESVLAQTYSPIEIILVDDGSTDETTLSICQDYRDNPSITLIQQSNGGAAKARNTGIDNARGKYIAFVDSDDMIDPDAYSRLREEMARHDVPVVLGSLSIEGARQSFGNSGLPDGAYKKTTILSKFLQGYWCSTCTNLYNSETINGIRFPENEINEDYVFNFEVLMRCDTIGIVNKPFYHYIRREESVTSKPASLRHLDWIKHATYIRDKVNDAFGQGLKDEADFQFLYANIILANKSIISIANGYTDEPNELFDIAVDNLRKEKHSVFANPFLKTKYKFCGVSLVLFPNVFKAAVSRMLKWRK